MINTFWGVDLSSEERTKKKKKKKKKKEKNPQPPAEHLLPNLTSFDSPQAKSLGLGDRQTAKPTWVRLNKDVKPN